MGVGDLGVGVDLEGEVVEEDDYRREVEVGNHCDYHRVHLYKEQLEQEVGMLVGERSLWRWEREPQVEERILWIWEEERQVEEPQGRRGRSVGVYDITLADLANSSQGTGGG